LVGRKNPEERILNYLCRVKECNLNAVRRDTGLSYYTLIKTINTLVAKGLVIEKKVGRLRLIRITEKAQFACMDKYPSTKYTSSQKTLSNTSR
jgi:DNA-binding MarR family transcriptional regulator